MEPLPPFLLQNVHKVLYSDHASPIESTPHHVAGSSRARTSQPPSGRDARITGWAADNLQIGSPAGFAARLDGAQVGAELLHIFRETPEFGRSLASRLDPFLDESCEGDLRLFGGGGEAIVFYDEAGQLAIKLLAPPGKARFGWVLEVNDKGRWGIRGGSLAEAVERFAWFESLFDSGLELDLVGSAGEFLVLSQPFIAGCHPDELTLHQWMSERGWKRCSLPTDLAMIANLTWEKEGWIATDVRPENALIAEADGSIRAIDFIIGRA
ncbi:hypothetical protein WJU23_22905 [Prosthecobacter sp. SYSU 5D2]|uniref:hypothetical protein n=1 Tax=Prosthecobacter sp. SYSU 5D2 TaxID=3134134 RepID=UPI0031FEB43D